MVNEKRREYMRKWRAKNRDRIREQQKENARRKALADMESVKHLGAGVCIIRANDGRSYVVTGRRK